MRMLPNILRNVFSRPATRMYPRTKRAPMAGYRGQLQLNEESCTYCGVCAKKCPSDALVVDRPAKTWTIQPFRCIGCGACVDFCPKKSLSMDGNYYSPAAEKHQEAYGTGVNTTAVVTKEPD